jgi:SAM-dependent methyltransferase
MKKADDVRLDVAKAYRLAVTQPTRASCCGGGPVQKGVVVKLGGYSSEELAQLPAAAVVNSFGCGNPVAMAELGPGQVVLDLGSGAGIDLFLAAKKVGPTGRAIGIDMTDAMLAKAAENIRAGGFANVEVRKGIIEDLPVESGSVDWVISNCVINLSPEKPKVFREIARVLRPGGRMLVSDIVAEDITAEVRAIPELYSSCVAGAISEHAYLDGLRAAGLVDVEVRERLVYDLDQLGAFFGSELDSGACGCTTTVASARLRQLALPMVGKIWSARVFARKPA